MNTTKIMSSKADIQVEESFQEREIMLTMFEKVMERAYEMKDFDLAHHAIQCMREVSKENPKGERENERDILLAVFEKAVALAYKHQDTRCAHFAIDCMVQICRDYPIKGFSKSGDSNLEKSKGPEVMSKSI